MKKYLMLVTLAFVSALLIGCTEKETQVEVSSVSLNTATIEMVEGETFNLVATVLPKDAEYDGVTWASSNASVASVNSGTVTAVKEGTATITASAGGKSATCTVKVSAKIIAVTSVSLDKASLSMQVGETETLTATVKPDDATDKTVVWTSSDDAVASVSNGKITALKSGKAIITAKSGTFSAECVVTVTVPVSSITLDKTALSLAMGESATLSATVKPDDATDKTVTWSSSNESVASVDNGKVTALTIGQAKITAVVGNITASCDVTVYRSDNVIIYTTTDKKVLKPYNEDAFGSAIVSNTYVDDVGIITFDKPLTFIGNMAFNEQSKLRSIVIPNAVSTIGKRAFYLCTGLLSVKLPQSLTLIDDNAFFSCSSITALEFPDNVLEIGSDAFSFCKSAFENNILVLPKKLQTVGSSAFGSCELRNVIWPENLKSIGVGAFYNNDFEEITVPGSVSYLGWRAFQDCELLKKAEFQEGITKVSVNCFLDCSKLSVLILPGSLKEIDTNSFDGCYMLKDVYIKATNPMYLGSLFADSDKSILSVYVPIESVDAYRVRNSEFKDNIKGYDF